MLATSFDVQILGSLTKQSPCREADHFIVVYVDGKEVLRSDKAPREPPPHWKEQKKLRFDVSSTIRIVVYRQSLFSKRFPLKKYYIAEYSGLGIELLDKDIVRELVDLAGHKVGPRISIQLDLETESHIDIWMCAPDTSPNYNAARKKHQPGTGSWFLDGPTFARWKEHPDYLLWLHGGPGCGKTVLCAAAIQHIIDFCDSKLSTGCAYFFFDGRNAEAALLAHEKLIRSIIMQLARRSDGVPAALAEMYDQCDKGLRQPSIKLLEGCLSRIVEAFDRVYIIIDSLDECSQRKDVVRWIRSMASGGSGKFHMMATSRREPEITQGLGSLSNLQEIGVSDQQVEADVRHFLNARLEESDADKWTKAQKDMMKEALIGGVDGMFRWVALQIDCLMKCSSELELEKQLKSLPRDLSETYCRILAESPDPANLKRFLQWLAFSNRMMTTEEIAEVAVIDFGKNNSVMPVYNPSRRYQDPRDVLGACYGLVTEVEANIDEPKAKRALKLAHFSVKEYLISEQILSGAAASFHTDEKLSHAAIVQTSLAYLLHFDQPCSITADNLTSFPLAEYAAEHWISHFHSSTSESGNTAIIQQLTLSLFEPSASYAMYNWLCVYNPDKPLGVNFHQKSGDFASPLYYACVAGLTAMVEILIVKGANVNATGGNDYTALTAASWRGHHDIVQLLLKHGADIDAAGRKRFNNTALQAACSKGHLDVVQLLLKHDANNNTERREPPQLDSQSVSLAGRKISRMPKPPIGSVQCTGNALQEACSEGYLEIVQLLLEHSADVNAAGAEYWRTALQEACSGGHLAIVRLLLKHGADVNAEGGESSGPALQGAAFMGFIEVVKVLLEHGANIDAEGGEYGTALQGASYMGFVQVVQVLLQHNANADAKGGDYGTALQVASARGHPEIVGLLLTHGANVNVEGGKHLGTALQAACFRGHLEIVQLLLHRGAVVNAASGEGSGTALQGASAQGHLKIVQLLLKHGANVHAEGGKLVGTALQAACVGGHLDIVQLLLEYGANVHAERGKHLGTALQATCLGLTWKHVARGSGTVLSAACSQGYLEIVQLLLEHGADVNATGFERSGTALQEACSRGHPEIVLLLVKNGADINAEGRGEYGAALQAASRWGHLEIVLLLVKHGANINAKGRGEYGTALQAASAQGHLKIVLLLVKNRADINAEGRGEYGTALQAASAQGHLEIVQLLLKHGSVVNAASGEGSGTALQQASRWGHLEIVQLLLKHGADVNAEGGRTSGTALQAACLGGNLEIVQLFLKHGANVNAEGGEFSGTALQGASYMGFVEAVQALLDHGADVAAEGPGEWGTALREASERDHLGIVKLLQEHGAVLVEPAEATTTCD